MTTTYLARTALGVTIWSFSTRELAMAWADDEGHRFPGWSIVSVTERIVIDTRVLRQDRQQEIAA
jgi:hypothetical protein